MSDPPANLKCPLCGFEFEKANTICHHGCPLGKFCKLIRCPGCQYEFPEPARPFTWLAKLLHPGQSPRTGALNLTELAAGETVEFVSVAGVHQSRQHTLALYGVVPGAQILLQQKHPGYVVRIGETELALEADIAREILVRRPATG